MSETLEFHEIESATRTEIAAAAADALDLTKIDLKDVALAQFGKWREKSAAARKTLTGVQHDLSTQAKIDDAKSLRHRLINVPLADARKVSKALKSKLNTVSGEVGAELVKIEADYAEVSLLITPLIDAREAEIAEEKRIAAEKEAERIAAIQAQIDIIRGYLAKAQAPDMTSARIQKGVELVEAMEIGEAFAELKGAAEDAKRSTLAGMLSLRDLAKAREDEAARLEAQRIENERIAAEHKAEADRLAAERAEFERQKAELAAAQKAIDDAKAEAERKEREAQEAAARAEQMARLEREREEEEKAQREQAASQAALIEQGREVVNDIIAAEVLRDAIAGPVDPMQDEAEKIVMEHGRASISLVQRYLRIGYNQAAKLIEAMEAKGLVTPMDSTGVRRVVGHLSVAECVAAAPAPARPIHPAAQSFRNEQPTLTLGAMKDRLGFTLTADFLAELGFEATPIKAARLYRESDWSAICQAISTHVLACAAEAIAA